MLILVLLLLLAAGRQPGRRPPERCYEHRYSRRSLIVRVARARLSFRVHRRGLRWAPGQRPKRRLHQRLPARGRAQPGISQQRHHDCPQHRRSHSIPGQLVAQHIGEGLQQIESPRCNSLQGQQVRRVQKSAQSETKYFPPDHQSWQEPVSTQVATPMPPSDIAHIIHLGSIDALSLSATTRAWPFDILPMSDTRHNVETN